MMRMSGRVGLTGHGWSRNDIRLSSILIQGNGCGYNEASHPFQHELGITMDDNYWERLAFLEGILSRNCGSAHDGNTRLGFFEFSNRIESGWSKYQDRYLQGGEDHVTQGNDVQFLKDINKLFDDVKCYLYSDDEGDYYDVFVELLDMQERIKQKIKNHTGKVELTPEENE